MHQRVDAHAGLIVGVAGQMRVAGRGEDRVVAENLLDFKQVDAGFDQVSRIAVPQTVRRDLFFSPQSIATWRKVFCTPPRSSGERALRAAFRPPWRLGKSSSG